MKTRWLLGLIWILAGCAADWGSEPFPELADIPDPPERASTIEEKRAIAAEMAADLAAEDELAAPAPSEPSEEPSGE